MLLLDSEPEATAAPPKGLPLTGSERNAILPLPTGILRLLLLSSSPSAFASEHFFQVLSRGAEIRRNCRILSVLLDTSVTKRVDHYSILLLVL